MPNRIVHFEIEAKNKERAAKFYEEAFGWKMQHMGENFGNYVVVNTGEFNDPKDPGINGGIMVPQGGEKQLNAFSCVIGVENIDKAIADVKKAGGQILIDKMDIPTVGLYVQCKDTEGNIFTMLQPAPMQPQS